MKCNDVKAHLDALLDETLADEQARAAREHIESCAACREQLAATCRLLEQARALPTSVEPPHDLWPDIAGRLQPRDSSTPGSRRWFRALGAVAASLFAAAVIIGFVASRQPGQQEVAEGKPSDLSLAARTALAALGGEAEFEKARIELRSALEQRKDSISPEAMAVVMDSLGVIDDSINGIRSALEDNPDNTRLARMLAAAYQREINLLQRATQLPAGM